MQPVSKQERLRSPGEGGLTSDFRLGLTVFGRSDPGHRGAGRKDIIVLSDLTHGSTSGEPGEPVTFRGGDHAVLLALAHGVAGAEAAGKTRAIALRALRWGMVIHQNQSIREADRRGWFSPRAADSNSGGVSGEVSLAAVLFHGPRALLAEIGDSHVYLLRDRQIVQLTGGQSYARVVASAGEKDKVQSPSPSPYTMALSQVSLRRGDRLLLCSSGLSRELKSDEMEALLLAAPTLPLACGALVRAASERGDAGGVAALMAEVNGEDVPPPAPGECISIVTVQSFSSLATQG